MKHYVGVDLGGTHLRAAIVNIETGELLALQRVLTQAAQGYESVIERMAGVVAEAIASSRQPLTEIGGIGVGVPGSIDLEAGMIRYLPNLAGHWPNVPLVDILHQQTGFPVRLINDVRSITLGEWTFGAGRGAESMVCYAIGTGIGGGVVVNGRLHLGISCSAGELGHQVVEMEGLACNCGGRGCLEMYASGSAITAQALSAVAQRRATLLVDLSEGDLNRINTELVVKAARQGDPLCVQLLQRAGQYIGAAVANSLVTISPRKVIFAGGAAAAGDLLLEPIRQTVKERVHLVPVDQVEILPAALGDNGGLLGAALWASLSPQSDRIDR
jgi:glucokinase